VNGVAFCVPPPLNDEYGDLTNVIADVIDEVRHIKWFETSGGLTLPAAYSIIGSHLRALAVQGDEPDLLALRVAVVKGSWSHLGDLLKSARGGDLDQADRWRDALGKLTRRLQNDLLNSRSSALRPPLFPVEDNPMVLGGMLVDVAGSLAVVPSERRDLAWSLVCDVDRDCWGELIWRISRSADGNPFTPLVHAYQLGLFPVGIRGSEFAAFMFQ
jgi:hypothetical protein